MGGDDVWLLNVTVYLVQIGFRVICRPVVDSGWRHANKGFALFSAGPRRVAAMEGATVVVDCGRLPWRSVQTR